MTPEEIARERIAEELHEVYLATAKRCGWPVRPDVDTSYKNLAEPAKELDRAFADWHLAALAASEQRGKDFRELVETLQERLRLAERDYHELQDVLDSDHKSWALDRATLQAREQRVRELEHADSHALCVEAKDYDDIHRKLEASERETARLRGALERIYHQGPIERFGANTPARLMQWVYDVRTEARAALAPEAGG
jgi:predicted phage-related endonuclease